MRAGCGWQFAFKLRKMKTFLASQNIEKNCSKQLENTTVLRREWKTSTETMWSKNNLHPLHAKSYDALTCGKINRFFRFWRTRSPSALLRATDKEAFETIRKLLSKRLHPSLTLLLCHVGLETRREQTRTTFFFQQNVVLPTATCLSPREIELLR